MKEYIVDVDGYIEDYEIEVHCPDWAKEKIIRCRDCCHYDTLEYPDECELWLCSDENGFCSWGKPKREKQLYLKPCPFCGNEVKIEHNESWYYPFRIKCGGHEVDGKPVHSLILVESSIKEQAAKEWNTRREKTCKMFHGHN